MDSCKIQVVKGQAKESIELIEGSPTQMPGLEKFSYIVFYVSVLCFLRFPVTMSFKQSVLYTDISC